MDINLNCLICSNSEIKQISNNHKLDNFKENFILEVCQSCSHVSIKNKPNEDQLTDYYKKEFWGAKVNNYNSNLEWNKILTSSTSAHERFIRSKKQYRYITSKIRLSSNSKIIDIGSGFAPILYHFNKSNYNNLYALDLDQDICKYLKRQRINSINSSLEKLSTSNSRFDLIIVSHTLEHVADPKLFLKLIKKISKNNTTLFIEVPYKDYLEPFNENLHLNFFSKKSLSIALENSNFALKDIEVDHHNFLDKLLLKLLFYIYGKFFFKSNRSINSRSKTIEFLHFSWRPLKYILSSKVNIHISRKNLRSISSFVKK